MFDRFLMAVMNLLFRPRISLAEASHVAKKVAEDAGWAFTSFDMEGRLVMLYYFFAFLESGGVVAISVDARTAECVRANVFHRGESGLASIENEPGDDA